MREHATYYKQFIDVHPGGGMRRNPKRKNVGAYSAPANIVPPSEADIDRVFDGHLQSMAKGGTYGDNMEISAFSSAFDVDVKIYQRDFAYMVSGGAQDRPREVAHIAYHVSVLNHMSLPLLTLSRCGNTTRQYATLTDLMVVYHMFKSEHCHSKRSKSKRRSWPRLHMYSHG